jgi:hypothetical protein
MKIHSMQVELSADFSVYGAQVFPIVYGAPEVQPPDKWGEITNNYSNVRLCILLENGQSLYFHLSRS